MKPQFKNHCTMNVNNNNCSDEVASFSAQYIEDYLDFVQNLPDDIQRHVTQLREIDLKYQEILREVDQLWDILKAKDNDPMARRRILLQAQNAMIRIQELGDSKLQIWQTILDMIDNKGRQLEHDFKRLDFGRENEVHNDNQKSDVQPERTSKRSRRQRHVDLLRDDNTHEKQEKEMPAPTICKKQKKKKRKVKVEKEQVTSPFEPPIDPDEPTYCLCDQVSYGEMICCDNQNCAREWFHFSCVGLNFKPKGKWYCPKCRGERSNQMKPQTS